MKKSVTIIVILCILLFIAGCSMHTPTPSEPQTTSTEAELNVPNKTPGNEGLDYYYTGTVYRDEDTVPVGELWNLEALPQDLESLEKVFAEKPHPEMDEQAVVWFLDMMSSNLFWTDLTGFQDARLFSYNGGECVTIAFYGTRGGEVVGLFIGHQAATDFYNNPTEPKFTPIKAMTPSTKVYGNISDPLASTSYITLRSPDAYCIDTKVYNNIPKETWNPLASTNYTTLKFHDKSFVDVEDVASFVNDEDATSLVDELSVSVGEIWHLEALPQDLESLEKVFEEESHPEMDERAVGWFLGMMSSNLFWTDLTGFQDARLFSYNGGECVTIAFYGTRGGEVVGLFIGHQPAELYYQTITPITQSPLLDAEFEGKYEAGVVGTPVSDTH